MDNASVHHYKVADIIMGVGSIVRCLPPYSPELNPIENVFSKIKAFLRANDCISEQPLPMYCSINGFLYNNQI
jgi:transposase